MPFFIAKNAIFFFLGFLAISIAIVGISVFLSLLEIEKEEKDIKTPRIEINENAYNQFLKSYSARESKISLPETHPDIFFRR